MQKQSGSGCAAAIWMMVLLLCIGLLVRSLVPAIINAREARKLTAANEQGYQQAIELYRQGNYSAADEAFGKLSYEYKHVKEYRDLCDAHRYYDKGNVVMAQFVLGGHSYSFLSQEEKEELDAFQKLVDRDYTAYKAQQAREDRQQLEERIRTEPPFCGMPESRISDTILGKYSKLETTTNGKDLEQWEVHNYSWMSGDKTLYYASCEKGTVVRVYNYRDHPKSSAGSGVDISPYPDISLFSNPGDFYWFYADDFDGYQDAEDFYYEHGGQ